MSSPERNRGLAVPVTKKAILKEFPNVDFDDLSYGTGGQFDKINEQYYHMSFEVKAETDCFQFVEVTKHSNGSIQFHTLHYNGGGSFKEVIENALTRVSEDV